MDIPKEFTRGKARPVKTVAGLIRQLKRLLPKLRIQQEDEEGARVVVYNVSTGDPFLRLDDPRD